MRFGRRDPHALAGVYALDALDDAERGRFERHLRRCQACQDEVRGFAATAAALGQAVAAAPPAGLKERVLAATTVTRQLAPVTSTPRRLAVPRRRGAEAGTTRPFGVIPKIATGIAAVSLAAAVTLAVITASTNSSLDAERARGQEIAAVLAAPDARIVSGPTTAGGTATVVASRRAGEIVFTSSRLRVLPSSQVYELWFIGPGGARRAGLVPAAAASGSTAPVLASGLETGDKIGVTVEPAGGTKAPTTTPIVELAVPRA